MILLLFGGPGSGKGAQANKLIEKYGFSSLSTGELLRKEIAAGTSLGQEVANVVKEGGLVSDDLITELVCKEVPALLEERDVILDGYPRTLKQVEVLDALCAGLCRSEIHVIQLSVEAGILEDRLLRRASCRMCGCAGSLTADGKFTCAACGAEEFTRRRDDTPESVRVRLASYEAVTAPVLEVYRQRGNLFPVDGSLEPDDVFASIERVLVESLGRA